MRLVIVGAGSYFGGLGTVHCLAHQVPRLGLAAAKSVGTFQEARKRCAERAA